MVLKKYVLFLVLLGHLVANRPFGRVIYDLTLKYDVSIVELRKLEKLSIKRRKAELDITFLKNCKLYNVIPKFLTFRIPYGSSSDITAIRKRLLRKALCDRFKDKRTFDSRYETELSKISSIFSSIDFYLLKRCINKNVQAMERKAKQQHDKKLRDLTHNRELPFTANETVVNLSTYELSDSEKDLLKFGLKFGLPPSQKVSVKDVASSFEALNGFLTANRKDGVDINEISAELSSLAQNYCSSYKPTRQTLKKHGILKKLRQNKNIVICKPDKGNSVTTKGYSTSFVIVRSL